MTHKKSGHSSHTLICIAMEIDSVFLEIGESGRQQVKYVAVLCLLKVRDEVYGETERTVGLHPLSGDPVHICGEGDLFLLQQGQGDPDQCLL